MEKHTIVEEPVIMEELVWRKEGERCERSYRTEKKALPEEDTRQNNNDNSQCQGQAQEQASANYMTDPSNTIQHYINQDGFHNINTKREDSNAKLSERYLVGQAKHNPFMPANNYVNDLEVQMNFLTPQKSN